MESMEALIKDFKITDITASINAAMQERKDNSTLLAFDSEGIRPLYAKKISATYMLMEWPLAAIAATAIRCYAFLIPHGKTHVVEIFFLKQGFNESFTGEYLGTTRIFSVGLPNNAYDSSLDEALAEALWLEVGGHGLQ